MAGYFVAFEGIDGCGKSSAARHIADLARKDHRRFLLTEDPTNGTIGRDIRELLAGHGKVPSNFEFQRLFVLDRFQHVRSLIFPTLARDTLVLSDRYWLSTLAYGMLTDPMKKLVELHETVFEGNFVRPNRTFFLDVSADIAIERIGTRGKGFDHFAKRAKLEKIHENYLHLADSFDNIDVIDAREPLEIVVNRIWTILEPLLPEETRLRHESVT